MQLEEAIKKFLFYHRICGHTDKTIAAYKTFLTKFAKHVGKINISNINENIIDGYIISLYNQEPQLSRATIRTQLVHLKAFLHWLYEKNILCQPLYKEIHTPKAPKTMVKLYQPAEIEEIFNAIKAEKPWLITRNKLIIALMIDSGLRQSEVSGAKIYDIDFISHTLKVYGKGNKERFVPLGKLTFNLLNRYMFECPFKIEDFLFYNRRGRQMTNNTIKMFVSKLQKKLGFKLSSHKLRHNFATNYVIDQYEQHGTADMVSLQYLMGHEDLSTTQNYLHIAQQHLACQNSISHLDKVL